MTCRRGRCRTLVNINYFNQAQSVALTVFGITAGIVMRFTHHYKILLIVGLAIRLLCVAPRSRSCSHLPCSLTRATAAWA